MKALLIACIVFLAAGAVVAGPDVSGLTTFGPVFRSGEKTWVKSNFSGEVAISKDTTKDRAYVVRETYVFENRPGTEDLQVSKTMGYYKQGLPFWKAHFAIGSGLVVQILDGEDKEAGIVGGEFGFKAWKDLGFVIGVDWIMGWDEVTPYLGIDLTPRF